ncbi:hypothetical protein VPNG_04172 [Cytospora leucostoma]|uniref:Myb-like domain-containing protein n=1 Tax=Cytospora leucostoma TaxID=1230097 RepID=A0A423XD66_9PEZI|nr:hypothetical protein VPNG_04172 [Cytospora leucostoma]
MSSDGHVSDRSRSVVDESDEVETEAEGNAHRDITHRRQEDLTQSSSNVDEESSNEIEKDGDVTDHSHQAGARTDGVETAQYAVPEDKVMAGSDVDEGDKSEGDASDDGQHLSPDQEPPSHQAPSEDSELSPNEAEISTASEAESVEGLMSIDDAGKRSKVSRKRKSPTEEVDPSPAEGPAELRPLKKAKGPLNRAYLDLLNEDIEHAAAQYVPWDQDPHRQRTGMPASQIGMTAWTPLEKERFFEALGRLGRDDAVGIARRIRTKGEMEVRQYMKLLQDAIALRRQQNELDPLELADFPAAIELSHECCQALEEAADGIALRQEHSEQTIEWKKHGEDWLVTQEIGKEHGENGQEGNPSDPAEFLNVPDCLKLSGRLFMNGPSEEANWQSVEGVPPSIRRTTLEDLHSLAVTLTRRLVAASIFMATSRIRAERGYKPDQRKILREKDIHAAAVSLGLGTETRSFLARCPRRLGLHVYEKPPKATADDAEGASELMAYDDVEAVLDPSGHRNLGRIRGEMERIKLSSDDDPMSSASQTESDAGSDMERSGSGASDEADSEDDEDEDIKAEADEIIFYSAVGQPQTKRDRQALFRRIKAEREQEIFAEAVDAQSTYQEESQLWGLLGQSPPEPLADPGSPPSGRRLKTSVDAAYSVGKDWRAKTKVISQWESQYQLHG